MMSFLHSMCVCVCVCVCVCGMLQFEITLIINHVSDLMITFFLIPMKFIVVPQQMDVISYIYLIGCGLRIVHYS